MQKRRPMRKNLPYQKSRLTTKLGKKSAILMPKYKNRKY